MKKNGKLVDDKIKSTNGNVIRFIAMLFFIVPYSYSTHPSASEGRDSDYDGIVNQY